MFECIFFTCITGEVIGLHILFLNVYFLLVLQVKLSVFTSYLHGIGVPMDLLIFLLLSSMTKKFECIFFTCTACEVYSLHKLFLNLYFLLVLQVKLSVFTGYF